MPISSDSYQALDDTINRLATESILAQPGRDECLVPAYSLLSDLREFCSMEAALREPITALHAKFESYLDAAKPFDDELIGTLRALLDWLPNAVECVKSSQEIPPFETGAVTPKPGVTRSPFDKAVVAQDELLDLHLEENRELLVEFHGEAVEHLQQIEAAL